MSGQQNPPTTKGASHKQASFQTPETAPPVDPIIAAAWGPHVPPDASYYAMEHDEPGLMGSIEILRELMSTYDMDPSNLIQIVIQCPPKLTKAIVHVVLRAKAAAEATKATKNNQKMQKDKKTKKKTGETANVEKNNEDAKSGESMAVKSQEDQNEKNQTKNLTDKASDSAEINAVPSNNQSAVSKSKKNRPKKRKNKASKAVETAENNPRVHIDRSAVPPTTKTKEKEKTGKNSKADEISVETNTKQPTIPESKKGKAKEKTGKDPETAKNNTGATIEQQAIPKSKSKTKIAKKTNKNDGSAENHTCKQAGKTQPETSTSPTKMQNNNKVERHYKCDKGKRNAAVSKPTDGGFFSALEVGCMQRSFYRVVNGIIDCQEVWYVVQMMQEAMVELQRAKAKQQQSQEQKESSAK
ncbi:hypothetical protein BDP81DRAFT_455928 [Colletotrichum phormii]|uniref:Uncharacterized protein n=1 Tax=Colletotrichum phormii TaxID=359342 RepID=A0AAI9ZC06_9PEZI|nr:uncharacterized protein BDP81DRAFT_455928 [Colletotrichum phormii]KAK1621728.1 hypothetical protein BDP81DRAFT_455928 [Colletotrichum phormii]